MRVIDLDDGITLQAANDDDLFRAVREHYGPDRPGDELSDDDVKALIEKRAYTAMDS